MMPLFIDRYPFHQWTDGTRTPPMTHWSVVLPLILSEGGVLTPPPVAIVQDWVFDTGNRVEAFAWRQHLVQAGLDPDQDHLPIPLTIRTVSGRIVVPVRDADLWLVSNIPGLQPTTYRIPLHTGLPFNDQQRTPDPEYERPLIGLRALRSAGVRVEIDFANDHISVWTPDVVGR